MSLILSWIGFVMDTPDNCLLGLFPAIKFFFFFVLGYITINCLNNMKQPKGSLFFLAILSFLIFITHIFVSKYIENYFSSQISVLYKCLLFTIFAITNGLLFVTIIKKYSRRFTENANKCFLLREMKKNTFEMYLYSDPLNYLIIYVGFIYWGNAIVTDNVTFLCLLVLRIGLSVLIPIIIKTQIINRTRKIYGKV